MGVPRLWSYVAQRNFGDMKSFPRRQSRLHEEFTPLHLIFDGPSFAYWFWREASLKQGTDPIKRCRR